MENYRAACSVTVSVLLVKLQQRNCWRVTVDGYTTSVGQCLVSKGDCYLRYGKNCSLRKMVSFIVPEGVAFLGVIVTKFCYSFLFSLFVTHGQPTALYVVSLTIRLISTYQETPHVFCSVHSSVAGRNVLVSFLRH